MAAEQAQQSITREYQVSADDWKICQILYIMS